MQESKQEAEVIQKCESIVKCSGTKSLNTGSNSTAQTGPHIHTDG